MAVTQYIGARYVPLFADPIAWDSTKEYEPLTIVTYQGNSYTSRQAVPRGIAISNEDFWALTGDYNAQIEQYRREVREYDDRINALNTAIDLINSQDVYIVIGDSFSSPTMDITWLPLAAKWLDCKFINEAQGRTGFNWAPSGTRTFYEQLVHANETISADDRAKLKGVICIGGINDILRDLQLGTNDYSTEGAFTSAIATIADYCANTFKVPLYYGLNSCGMTYRDGAAMPIAIRRANSVSGQPSTRGIPMPNVANHVMIYPDSGIFKDDNLHPNQSGCNLIANIVVDAIKGSGSRLYRSNNTYFSANKGNIHFEGKANINETGVLISGMNVRALEGSESRISETFTVDDLSGSVLMQKTMMICNRLRTNVVFKPNPDELLGYVAMRNDATIMISMTDNQSANRFVSGSMFISFF